MEEVAGYTSILGQERREYWGVGEAGGSLRRGYATILRRKWFGRGEWVGGRGGERRFRKRRLQIYWNQIGKRAITEKPTVRTNFFFRIIKGRFING